MFNVPGVGRGSGGTGRNIVIATVIITALAIVLWNTGIFSRSGRCDVCGAEIERYAVLRSDVRGLPSFVSDAVVEPHAEWKLCSTCYESVNQYLREATVKAHGGTP